MQCSTRTIAAVGSLLLAGSGLACAAVKPTGCTVLAKQLPDKVFLPGTETYAAEAASFWSNTQLMDPACVFVPGSAADVAKGIKANTQTLSPWAVRGGGHMGIKGANNIDGGMLFVMSNLTALTVAEDKSTVELGPGLKWGDVYTQLAAYNLTVAGGRLSPVGVPGLLLGGGISFLANQAGWGADQVVSYEIVLASGEISTVSATSKPDLFWALKGGSANFGIVTKFTVNAFKSTQVYAGTIIVGPADVPALISAMANYSANTVDPLSHIVPMTVVLAPGTVVGSAILFYDSDSVDPANPPAALAPFLAIPQLSSTVSTRTLADFAIENGGLVVDKINDIFVAGTSVGKSYEDHLTAANLQNDIFMAAIPALYEIVPVAQMKTLAFNWQPISPTWEAASKAANPGGNALGIDTATKGTYLAWAGVIEWEGDDLAPQVDAWVANTTAAINAAVEAQGLFDSFNYMGDAAGFQEVYEGYGAENKAKLLSVSRKYDPLRIFQKLWPGGFKIGQ